MAMTQQRLEVARNQPARYQFTEVELAAPGDGEVVLQLDRFGLSANNVTYAALGDALHYADFFPAAEGDRDWSMLPVWGVAQVLESRSEWVRKGDLVYGYFPSASHCLLHPQAATGDGFRVERPAIPDHFALYHRYGVAGRDPMYVAEQLDRMVVLRPLFTTSLLLADYLADERFANVPQLIFSSAGSKTALGTARLLAGAAASVVGLGSAGSHALAREFGGYGRLLDYAQLEELDAVDSVYVDFSGDAAVRERIFEHLGDKLQRVISIGLTHWQQGVSGKPKGDYASEIFFAPGRAAQRQRADAQFGRRLVGGWRELLEQACGSFAVDHQVGREHIEAYYSALVAGRADGSAAHSFSF